MRESNNSHVRLIASGHETRSRTRKHVRANRVATCTTPPSGSTRLPRPASYTSQTSRPGVGVTRRAGTERARERSGEAAQRLDSRAWPWHPCSTKRVARSAVNVRGRERDREMAPGRPLQLVAEARTPLPARLGGRRRRIDYEYRRSSTCDLFTTIEPLAGWRDVEVTLRRTAIDFAH